jgi:hypothetical protein
LISNGTSIPDDQSSDGKTNRTGEGTNERATRLRTIPDQIGFMEIVIAITEQVDVVQPRAHVEGTFPCGLGKFLLVLRLQVKPVDQWLEEK